MSLSQKIDLFRDFAAGPEPHIPPPLHIVYMYTVLLFTQGRGGRGRVEQQRRLEGHSSQSWVENTNMTDCISSL
jgi:hypothetical protein